MRILVFSWRDPKHPLAGGAEQVMHEHMRGWVHAGHRVVLFASRFRGSSSSEIIDGVEIIRQGNQYFLGVQLYGFLFYLKNRGDYDVVVDQFHGIPFFTPLYVKKPILAVIQETAREVWFLNYFPWPFNFIIGFIGYLSEPVIFLLYRNIIFMTGSESAKQDVVKCGIPANQIVIVPHGVLVQDLNPMPKKEKEKTILFLGKLSKDKGIEDALKCFSILNQQGEYNFWVVGQSETTSYENKIKQVADRLNLTKNLRFWGYISSNEKFTLLARAHLLINPSKKEGWGLVNIEANYFGTPVVAYPSKGLIDSVKDGVSGIICKENTPYSLASEILRLYEVTNRLSDMSQSAKKWSRRFSWDKSKRMSLSLIQKLYAR